MVPRSGKEVHDKEEGLKTVETDLETKTKNDSSLSTVMYDSIITYKPKVPYPQALDTPFSTKKDKQRDDILEIFKQVKVNIPLLEVIIPIPTYTKLRKDMCAFKRK